MNGVGERRHVRPALIGPSLRMNGVSEKGRVKERETETERERERERERPDWECAAESGKSLFFTIAFIF